MHKDDYDKAILENGWPYRLSNDVRPTKSDTAEACKQALPPFLQASFLKYIIRFVVADDQVSNAFSR